MDAKQLLDELQESLKIPDTLVRLQTPDDNSLYKEKLFIMLESNVRTAEKAVIIYFNFTNTNCIHFTKLRLIFSGVTNSAMKLTN